MCFSASPGLSQLSFPVRENLLGTTLQLIDGSDISDGAVKPLCIVMVDKFANLMLSVIQTERSLWPDALFFQGLMEPFHLPIALRIKGRCAHVSHSADADEFFEIIGDKLRSIVRDDTWLLMGKPFSSALDDDLHILLRHRLADFPVHDIAAVPVKQPTKIVERAGNIEITDIDMPVPMGVLLQMESDKLLFLVSYPVVATRRGAEHGQKAQEPHPPGKDRHPA